MEYYVVAFCRDNKISTIMKITTDQKQAGEAFIRTAVRCKVVNPVLDALKKDVADGYLNNDYTFNIGDGVTLQLHKELGHLETGKKDELGVTYTR